MLNPIRTVAPAVDLVTLAEAKAHVRVDSGDDDALISGFIAAAIAHLDGYSGVLGRALVSQTWSQAFAGFAVRMDLPLAPAQSVVAVTYFDTNGTSQTVPAEDYLLHEDARGPYLTPVPGASWPQTQIRDDAVSIKFIAGYGEAAADVPGPLHSAALLIIGALYENHENQTPVQMFEPPVNARFLYAPFRRISI